MHSTIPRLSTSTSDRPRREHQKGVLSEWFNNDLDSDFGGVG